MWEKEKLLVMSDFSFSCSVFYRLILQTCENKHLFGTGLRRFVKPNYPGAWLIYPRDLGADPNTAT